MSLAMAGLRRDARKAAFSRGHKLREFETIRADYTRPYQRAVCARCGRQVVVTSHPMPNEATIMGEAVALNCLEGAK